MTNHVQSFRVAPPDKGRLISFEAVDGAGKDTVADRVIAWLERSGHPVFDFDQAGYAVPIPPEADVLKISEPS